MSDVKKYLSELEQLSVMKRRLAREEVPLLYAIAREGDFPLKEVAVRAVLKRVVKKMKKVGGANGVRFFFNMEDGEFYSGENGDKKVIRSNGRDRSYLSVVMLYPSDRDWPLLAKAMLRSTAAPAA